MDNMEEVITEAVEDATPAPEPAEDTPSMVPDGSPEPEQDEPEAEVPTTENVAPTAPSAVPQPPKPVDDFEKKHGIPALSVTGRENRIPYSRVKKITEKAVSDAKKELETQFTPKLKAYEDRFKRVTEFENVMVNQPDKFLQILSSIPVYRDFFQAVEQAFANGQNQQQPQAQVPIDPDAGMPGPDEELADGTKVYSMKGLSALNAWNREQARKETLDEVKKIYGPIQQEWEVQQRYNQAAPVVHAQIAEARTWDLFNENEDEITKVLQRNPKMSLEGAYNRVVLPKIKADRQKMREEILQELKKAPKATSAPTTGGKAAPAPAGKRSMEDIIREQIKDLPR